MKFAPKTKDEIAQDGLLPKGNYPFEVVGAEDTQSKKSGKDMIALNLRFFGTDGRPLFVKDYLLEAMAAKLRGFCEEVGVLDKYEAGTLCAEDCEGKAGYATLKIEQQEGFDAKNAVSRYGKPKVKDEDAANTALATASKPKDPDDDLPTWD